MKVYIAGPLFNEAEIAQRKLEGKKIRNVFPTWDIFNPIDQPFNENKHSLPTPIEIFEGDTRAVEECDIFICDLSVEDVGVATELGVAIYTNTKTIIGINSDIRLGSSNQYEVPTLGMNHYVLGGILKHGHFVHSFDQALDLLKDIYRP